MHAKDLRTHAPERLNQMAAELRATIRNLRFTVGTRERTNVRDLRKAKRDLARVLTVSRAAKSSASSTPSS